MLGMKLKLAYQLTAVDLISDSQQATEIAISSQSTSPQPDQNIQPQIEYPTPTDEALPTSPVSAGVPITYGGWSMTVSPEIRY
jgi:hypothetical protein